LLDGGCAGQPGLLVLSLKLPHLLDDLFETIDNHLDLGFLNHAVCQFDELVDFLVLFLEDGFLGIDEALLVATLFFIDSFDLDVVLGSELVYFGRDSPVKLVRDFLSDILNVFEQGLFSVVVKQLRKSMRAKLVKTVKGKEVDVVPQTVSAVLYLKEALARVIDCEEKVLAKDG
jgi:hypothetical protein